MGVTADRVRRLARALPGASEEPHFHLASFRVGGKIFATLAPDGSYLNVFVGDEPREMMVVDPEAYETLRWGKKIAGLHVRLAAATSKDVAALLRMAWESKAPPRVRAALEAN